jgi:hypothetical protein
VELENMCPPLQPPLFLTTLAIQNRLPGKKDVAVVLHAKSSAEVGWERSIENSHLRRAHAGTRIRLQSMSAEENSNH